jgi:CheY-like chemotaxis protein
MRIDNVTQSREGPSGSRMRVIVADDDVLPRGDLANLLERSGFAVAGQAGDAEELLDLVRTHAPDLVIVDIRMPPTHTEEGQLILWTAAESAWGRCARSSTGSTTSRCRLPGPRSNVKL